MLRHLLFGSKPRRNFSGFCPRPNAFSRSALQVIDSRPRVTLPSAASSATCGREQHEQRPRVDNVSLSHEGHRLGGGGNLLKTQRLPAADARREGRPRYLIPPVAKRCYPRPFPLLHHAPSALLFLLFIICIQQKEK